jgi:hypothetical protein
MKLILLVTISAAVLLFPGALCAQFVQSPVDSLAADTLDMVFSVQPYAAGGLTAVRADLYVYCDAIGLTSITTRFGWDSPDIHMDSAFLSPQSATFLNLFNFLYDKGNLDTTNANQRFQFAAASLRFPLFPPSTTRQLLASYFFTVSNWDAADTVAIDTLMWNLAVPFRMWHNTQEGELRSYSPYWSGPKVIRDTPPSCCVLRTGDANCLDGDEPTLGDVMALVDYLFISGLPPCCITEADVDQSGGSDPTLDDITLGDCMYLQDYLFVTGPSLGLPDCY